MSFLNVDCSIVPALHTRPAPLPDDRAKASVVNSWTLTNSNHIMSREETCLALPC